MVAPVGQRDADHRDDGGQQSGTAATGEHDLGGEVEHRAGAEFTDRPAGYVK